MTRRSLLIVKLGTTFAELAGVQGDFEVMVARRLNIPDERVGVIHPPGGDRLGDPRRWAGIVLTGAPEMVTDRHGWSERTALWLASAVRSRVPVLGICYGHQLLAEALGGQAGDNPNGREFGTVDVELTDEANGDPLLGDWPAIIPAHTCHAQTVTRLPDGAIRLATSRLDGCQAFRVAPRAWGVQFHPEFDADATRFYVRQYRSQLADQGEDVEALLAGVRPAPECESLIARFARYVDG